MEQTRWQQRVLEVGMDEELATSSRERHNTVHCDRD